MSRIGLYWWRHMVLDLYVDRDGRYVVYVPKAYRNDWRADVKSGRVRRPL